MAVIGDTGVRTRTIVVGVVGDRWAGSLAYALKLSLAEAAKVRIVRVSATEPAARAILGLPLAVVEASGDPAEVLFREARDADLLVVESQSDAREASCDPVLVLLRRRVDTLLIEVDADGEIVRASGAAGWTYSARPDMTFAMPAAEACHEGTICVGVDASAASRAAVEWSVSMAARTGSPLTLISIHADDPRPGQRSRSDAQSDIDAAVDLIPGPRPASVVASGEPAECLLEASRGASMLVLGRHGTRGLIHSALGSVGDTCARLADCPVVVLPQREVQAGTDHTS